MAGHNNFEVWRNHQRFNKRQNFLNILSGALAVLMLLIFFVSGYLAVKATQYVEENGLKTIAERVWYGPEEDDEADETSKPD